MPCMRLEFRDKKSSKFWEIDVRGTAVTVRFGKIGADGQKAVRKFGSGAEARAHADKSTAEKLRKGYVQSPGTARSSAASVASPGVGGLKSWLAEHRGIAAVIVTHPAVDRFEIGDPLVDHVDEDGDGEDGERPRRRARSRTKGSPVVAVERTTYFGLQSRYAVAESGQCSAMLDGLAHGFSLRNVRIDQESMGACVESDRWEVKETEYFSPKSGRWVSLSASASSRFDGKSDEDSPFSGALLVPCDPSAESVCVIAAGKRGTQRKEIVIPVGSPADARLIADTLALALNASIPRRRPARDESVPSLVWPRCVPRSRGFSELDQCSSP